MAITAIRSRDRHERDDRRLAIELDGDKYHGPDRWADDIRRQRALERLKSVPTDIEPKYVTADSLTVGQANPVKTKKTK